MYGATNVVVVNEAFARKFFPQQDPIGQHVRDTGRDTGRATTDSEIIGVVGDVRTTGWINRQNHAYTDRFFSARVNCLQSFFAPLRTLPRQDSS